jgi:wyosine [tRNA(Phe)-imidazoG37] synthetase (radical SAM superfamily)
MYKHLFGPVPSRRLGMSLGVDLVPHKVCSLDCVYCECGPTKKLTLDRKEYILYKKVTAELEDYFKNNPDPDYITFSGNGEPTLNSRIGDVLKFIKNLKPNVPVAVLTNGTLLWSKEVRNEILDADLVIPSLDANVDADFQKINVPAKGLTLEKYLQGLIDFRKEYSGKIWLEVLIIPEYNDDEENILKLKDAILKIKPDKIQLNTLDRPGTIPDLKAAPIPVLKHILSVWNLPNAEIIAAVPERKNMKAYRKDIENAILETISRRPCTLADLEKILGVNDKELNKYLGVMENDEKIEVVRQQRGFFYKIKK